MTNFLQRTWAMIDLDHLDHNIFTLQSALPPKTKLMGVVKADGYGHGDRYIARELSEQGIDFFAVSNLAEALSLRRENIRGDILVLGFTPPSQASVLAQKDIVQTVFSPEYASLLHSECERQGVCVRVHFKLDTGMNRIGFPADCEETFTQLSSLYYLPQFHVEGIFSHFSSADEDTPEALAYTQRQLELYRLALSRLEGAGLRFSCKHLQNSAGIAFLPGLQMDYARAGIVMYGVAPSDVPLPFRLEPVMELKTIISMVKEIPAGQAVSYGRRFIAAHPMKVATVPIGYADGYPRALSNRGEMLLHGKRVPILGNICMDQLILDVTEVDDVQMGDIVTVVGRDGVESVTFDELAALTGTISYELMCLIGRRVPRVYRKHGKTIAVVDYIND